MDATDSWLFWALWLATVAIAAIAIIRAAFKPNQVLGLALVACPIWIYFYGYMAEQVGQRFAWTLPAWALEFGQAMALVSLIAMLVGWWKGQPGRVQFRTVSTGYRWRQLWWISATTALMAAGSQYAFRVSGQSAHVFSGQNQLDWTGTSAYWYLAFYFGYPALALMLIARHRSPRLRSSWHTYAFAFLIAVSAAPHVLNARRGPLFPFVIVIVYVPGLARRLAPKPWKLLGTLAATGFLMLLFVQVRPWIYHEDSGLSAPTSVTDKWSTALESIDLDEVATKHAQKMGDNEFLYHCAMIATTYSLGLYDYGTGYLELFVHWIPRQLWPAKPSLGEGAFEPVLPHIPEVTGWSMTNGAAGGGVADAFTELGFFTPLLWFGLGWLAARVYSRAWNTDDPRWLAAYIGMLCSIHWAISQGVIAAAVPFCAFQALPLLILWFVRITPKERHAMSLGRSTRVVPVNADAPAPSGTAVRT